MEGGIVTALRLLVDLLLITPRLAWAWLQTKLPHAPAPVRRCYGCGWALDAGETSLLCEACQDKQERMPEFASKLFCCDVDLEYQRSSYSAGAGHYQSTRCYRCPSCGRIWLYISEWYKDSGSDADWYPQAMEADGGELPDLFDERTRTKVYD
jgi:hypothetical protein